MVRASFALIFVAPVLAMLGACGDAPLPGAGAIADAGRDAGKDAGYDAGRDAGDAGDAGAAVDGGPVEAGPCTNRTYANFGQAWIQSRCNGCHGTLDPKLTSKDLLLQHLDAVKATIGDGRMPPPPTTLPAAEKTIALQWLNCGAP